MKLFAVLIGVSVAFSAATFIAVPEANAAQCPKSCTAMKNGCIKGGGDPARCSAGYADCKRTGAYAGMPSGRTWTGCIKK
jgi:hypothetical protein